MGMEIGIKKNLHSVSAAAFFIYCQKEIKDLQATFLNETYGGVSEFENSVIETV